MNVPAVLYTLGLVGVVAFCGGCTHMHRVVNTGDSMLYAVTVQSGETKFGHGYLPQKCWATYKGSMRITGHPAPVVSWKLAENGDIIARKVELNSEPRGREVVFEIDGKTVKGMIRDP